MVPAPSPTPATAAQGRAPRLLLVIPGDVNYFYNLYARWMAEAFRGLGARVELCELAQAPPGAYDLVVLSNVAEILHSAGKDDGARRVEALGRSCGAMINFSAECVRSRWFRSNVDLCRDLGIGAILDIGFRSQRDDLGDSCRGAAGGADVAYHFAFDGLLEAQARSPRAADEPGSRTIPWAHVGVHTRARVELTDRLVSEVSPRGLIYLPEVSPVKEEGSPHLGPGHMERILARTKSYVWCSHHEHFYMESLRFKTAWLSGCLPMKVVGDGEALPDDLPFSGWVAREGEMGERLRSLDFEGSRAAFDREYRRRPRLDDGLALLLEAYGLGRPAASRGGDVEGRPARRCA